MKMLAVLGGELSNSATYFSTFGNVSQNDSNDYMKSFGLSKESNWKPWNYENRLSDAEKVIKK